MIRFFPKEFARVEEMMWPSFWPYGVNENHRDQRNAALVVRIGLSYRKAAIEDTFAPATITIGGLK